MAVAVSDGFIGRGNELVRLLAALERAQQGSPGLVLVVGEAGVGKSRQLTELAAQARRRGAQVLVGGCLEVSDVGLPYVPIISALRSVMAGLVGRWGIGQAACWLTDCKLSCSLSWLRCCLPVSRRSPCRSLPSPRAAMPVRCGQGGTRWSGWVSEPTARWLRRGTHRILQLQEGRSATGENCVGRSLAAPTVPHRNAPGCWAFLVMRSLGNPDLPLQSASW